MTARFLEFVDEFVFPNECHFKKGHWGDMNYVTWENVPGDRGGVTKYGIDQRSHPSLDIKNLTIEEARQIYWLEYWVRSGAEAMPYRWGEALADIKINGGDGPRMAQRALNKLGAGLRVDGNIGLLTREAMVKYSTEGVEQFLLDRDARYRNLARRPDRAKFLKGWLNRNNNLRRFLGLVEVK